MIKKYFIAIILFSSLISAQAFKFGEAKGLFMSVGVGPRIPLGDFADTHNLGVGFDVALSYTDNFVIPVFLFSEIGFQHYPGSQDYYKESDHSSISSNVLVMNFGARHYYKPLVENIVLLMPVIEAGLSVSYFETSHILKIDSGKNNFIEDSFNVGFTAGIGVSMFMLDVMSHYHYFKNRQYISFDLRVRIPVFVTF